MEDKKLRAAERKKLKSSQFCGPNRSFPVPDCCLAAETEVLLSSGETMTIGDIADYMKDETEKPVFVAGYNALDNQVFEVPVAHAWLAREKAPRIELFLSNGESVVCTDNHPFLSYDGVYIDAGKLQVGDKLVNGIEAPAAEILVDSTIMIDSVGRLPASKQSSDKHGGMNGDVPYLTVIDIRDTTPGPVYDMEIPLVNNFILKAGPVVHNSHVRAALRLLNRAKVSDATKAKIRACVMRKNKSLGCGVKSSKDALEGLPEKEAKRIIALSESEEFEETREFLDFLELLEDDAPREKAYTEHAKIRMAHILATLRDQDDEAVEKYMARGLYSLLDSILDHLEQDS